MRDAGNVSEPIRADAVLKEAAVPAFATPIPPQGIAATLGPNESHTYFFDPTKVNFTLSLAECAREPLNGEPLSLHSGSFEGSTEDGGLLSISNLTLFNSTIVVSSGSGDSNTSAPQWSYQLGMDSSASLMGYKPSLYWVDSDFGNSLFVTMDYRNFSVQLQNTVFQNFLNYSDLNSTTRKFNLFLRNANDSYDTALNNGGVLEPNDYYPLSKSYCAMQSSALLNQNNCDFSTTNRGSNETNTALKGQFLFKGLNRSTLYGIQLGIPPQNNEVLGGMLFPIVPFTTKESTSCQLIYNMTTCPNTAFSVPGNASLYTTEDLTELYDDYVKGYYSNFSQALDQVNCNASRENRYSVFSTCDDCASAYLDWVCTVAVPRCADWGNDAPYLVERPENSSRNAMINSVIRPGAYKEIMPCYWLCNNLATYCPVSMGFSCPSKNLLNLSYGFPSDNGDISCSYPGAVYSPDRSWFLAPSYILLILCLLL